MTYNASVLVLHPERTGDGTEWSSAANVGRGLDKE